MGQFSNPILSPVILGKTAIPFIVAPSGVMGANGAITLGTAVPSTYANCYLFLAANSINGANAAGWYYAQMASATVGQVFQNTYSGLGTPVIPSVPLAWVSGAPGAYVGVTGLIAGPSFTLSGFAIGPNGALRIVHMWQYPNNADNKTLRIMLGASAVFSTT